MLHLDFDYKFHSEVLHVAGEHELLLHSASKRKTFSGDMLSNNSVVMVTCLRQGTPEGLNETSELKMKWHWATKDGNFIILSVIKKSIIQNAPAD